MINTIYVSGNPTAMCYSSLAEVKYVEPSVVSKTELVSCCCLRAHKIEGIRKNIRGYA
jgi:hypothetical protein